MGHSVNPLTANSVGSGAPDGDEISVRDLWYLLLRNKWLIVGSFAFGAGGAAVYAKRATPVYEASASIRIDEKRSSLPVLDVLKDVGSGSELATEMEVLRSRSLAERVVDSLALQVTLVEPRSTQRDDLLSVLDVADVDSARQFALVRSGNGFRIADDKGNRVIQPGQRISLGGAEMVLKPAALEAQRIGLAVVPARQAVQGFSGQLTVNRPSRDANVVNVRFRGTDPGIVRDVPNMLAQTFIATRNAVKKTEARSTIDFLRTQIDTLALQLAASEDALRAFRQKAGVVSLTDEASTQVERLATLQAERASIDAERSALRALLSEVQGAAAVAKPEDPSPYRRLLAFPTLLRNPAISQLLASLNAFENERTQLLIRRTVRDPDVVTLSVRVREMEEEIRSLATTYLQGLTNQVASIDAELARFNTQLQQVPSREVEYARLVRQPKILEDLYVTLQARLKEAEVAAAVQDPSVRVVDSAILPEWPIKPNKPLIVLIGGMLGLMAGLGGAFMRQSLDQKVRSREDVLRITGAVVLGIIPRIDSAADRKLLGGSLFKRLALASGNGTASSKVVRGNGAVVPTPAFASRLVTGNDPRSPIAEAYRSLRTNITFARLDDPPKTLVFTSAMPGDGKSTTSSNLAITLVQQGQRVLLVDADMRKGVLNEVFHQRRDPGLSNLVMGGADPATAIRKIPVGQHSLHFLPTGSFPPNPAELIGSERMQALLASLEKDYDVIIVDSPPLNVVTDGALLGTKSDGVVVVTRAAKTTTAELEFAMLQLMNVRAPLLGIVLNDIKVKDAERYGYGSYQAYFSEAE